MTALNVETFEPVYLVPEGAARLTEYGKRFFDRRLEQVERFWHIIGDVVKLADSERQRWPEIEAALAKEGVPTAISSGMSAYGMSNVLPHYNGKTAWTMPGTVAMALGTAAPSVSTTGNWGATESSNYGGYGRLTFTTANWSAVTGTAPATQTYSTTGAVTFANCTSGSATLGGFLIVDSSTIGAGNALWYGTLASVTISTTQTPPTLAQNALTVSLNGT